MTLETARVYDAEGRQARAERILDVAAELLERWGYKRLTMDDVATAAGIGKGTIYLHWKTREALFEAVLHRELAALLAALVDEVRRDPESVIPHRLARTYYLWIMQRPLLRALFTGDNEMLGKLARAAQKQAANVEQLRVAFVEMLARHGLVRTDLPPEEIAFALRTLIVGFLLANPLMAMIGQPSLERRADLLAMSVKAFELDHTLSQPQLAELGAHIESMLAQVPVNEFRLIDSD